MNHVDNLLNYTNHVELPPVYVNFDRNPVLENKRRKKHWDFLTKRESFRGKTPTRTRSEIELSLVDALLEIHHVMINSKNLVHNKNEEKKKSKLDQIFNARTMHVFLKKLLCDPTTNSISNSSFQYNFKTAEFARLMFELSKSYFLNSSLFVNDESSKEYLTRISDNFKKLSREKLTNEDQNKTIPKKEQDRINELLTDYRKGLNENSTVRDKCHEFEKILEQLYAKLYRLDIENKRIKIGNKKKTKTIKNNKEIETVLNTINKYESGLDSWKELLDKEEILENKLQEKYTHLSDYFCSENNLEEFFELTNHRNQRILPLLKEIESKGKNKIIKTRIVNA